MRFLLVEEFPYQKQQVLSKVKIFIRTENNDQGIIFVLTGLLLSFQSSRPMKSS